MGSAPHIEMGPDTSSPATTASSGATRMFGERPAAGFETGSQSF